MAEKRKAILVRLPATLADALQQWAAHELRSLNGQIEYVLREAVRGRGHPLPQPPADAPTTDENRPEDP